MLRCFDATTCVIWPFRYLLVPPEHIIAVSFAAEGLKDAGGGDPEAEPLPGMFAHSRDSMIDLTWSDRIFDLSSDHGMVLIISA